MSNLPTTNHAFAQGAMLPPRHTCDGEDLSPRLMVAKTQFPATRQGHVLAMGKPMGRYARLS